ncbi:MAG: ribbon-helix-helix domain-containing protein [Roseibium album]|uniref:Ribbon-helix-helix domain-containing protein n=1 Tax=Roseibium album TaxID=311410 RepID=A0A0M6ZE02_9HYPH|nr:ribbon-helix-helix domain-containing protein [Roseibium album]MBG6144904.1 putative DNA-binding ribbon-helix-helix protein [Labrenzia sp. EL_142]MBG6156880.1 putative DNA-binding ribbon-helix-helix protein [Labrenzia sp. EL_162]MBG6163508.1 putative DNA-binding ribbon-helix-helix protein [Labrenzia sp. EL_195]MBG6173041.1 putative DNA-binding ribbon-helix-helix protein [Labrenzia sp. EL_132]MBG6195180.1 putative DNA-binding ribbon-helix-helix protein [Labrenzia sp. EL_159]MBG6203241.1 puta
MCQIFAGQDPERYASQTRSMRLNGQSTSIRLENTFWEIIDEIARRDNVSTPTFISTLHSEVLQLRGEPTNFTSLLRCACLKFIELNPGIPMHDMSSRTFEETEPENKFSVV